MIALINSSDMITEDTFFEGQLLIYQQKNGYRYSIDAVLLAHHAVACPAARVLDLGSGCGIIPLIMAFKKPDLKIYAVEIQSGLAEIAQKNISANRMEDRITLLHKDMKSIKHQNTDGTVDLVVSNPPYRRMNAGRMNPDQQRAAARHEIMVTLSEVVETARRMLDLSGRFVIIYPTERLAELLSVMREFRLEPKYLRMIYSGLNTEARLVLVEGVKGGRTGLKAGPPLIIYEEGGGYTHEVEAMMCASQEVISADTSPAPSPL